MSGKHYTPEEIALVVHLAEQGFGATAIARRLAGRTSGGVQSQLVKLGYVDQQRSAAAKARKHRAMNGEQHKQFREFLRNNIEQAPPLELMRHWNEQATQYRRPTVSIDMVDYWVDKMRLRLSPAAAAANPAYQAVKRLRYVKRGETARATFESKADKRRQELRARRTEIAARDRNVPQRVCPDCGENWPLTEEFYRAKTDRNNGKLYFEARGCILCANKVRRRTSQLRANGLDAVEIRRLLKAEERQRRNAKASSAIAKAQAERVAILGNGKACATQTCLDCNEDWPLRNAFWKRESSGGFPRFCRFCDSRYRREQKRARADGRPLAPIRAARRALLEKAHDQQRRARREELQRQAKKWLSGPRKVAARVCSICGTTWPLKEEFWLFEAPDSPRAGKLTRTYCRCCSHDKDAERNRWRKR